MITIGVYTTENERIRDIIDEYMKKQEFYYGINLFSSSVEMLRASSMMHLLIIDIEFSEMDGVDAIEISKKVRIDNQGIVLIFISRYSHMIYRVVNEAHPFAFLCRPFRKEVLISQLEDLKTYINYKKRRENVIRLKLIHISDDGLVEYHYKNFVLRDILSFEYINRKIKVSLYNNEYYFIDTLKNVFDKIQKYNFEYCHKSCIVNIEYIEQIKGYEIRMKNGNTLKISQKKSNEFRKKMKEFNTLNEKSVSWT